MLLKIDLVQPASDLFFDHHAHQVRGGLLSVECWAVLNTSAETALDVTAGMQPRILSLKQILGMMHGK